jgi:GTPase SAR1 family protein
MLTKNSNGYELSLKINFLGDSNCGKTCLIKSLLYSKFFDKENETILNIHHVEFETQKDFQVSFNI